MAEESGEIHSEDDKTLLGKSKKRTVKTHAQVVALEKFYNEHKYPTEIMKLQVAESIGLTEKQVSGWFCHRRLKDKRLVNEEKHMSCIRQDRSSGVIQDHGSGLRQDSCGSTKQGDNRNPDTREVESERLTTKEFFNAADQSYEHISHHNARDYNNHVDGLSSRSSSLMSNHQDRVPVDAATSRYLVPKFHATGYLKVKGLSENRTITAVKQQLGKHYREDGPPLGVEFDPLPPGAFESSTWVPIEENHYVGEDVLPISPHGSDLRQSSNSCKGRKFKPNMAFENRNVEERSFRTRDGYDIHDSHARHKFRQALSLSNSAVYDRNAHGVRAGQRVEVKRKDNENFSGNSNLQPYGGTVREEPAEFRYHKYSDVGPSVSLGENAEIEYSSMTEKGSEYYGSGERGLSRQIVKDGKPLYPNNTRRMDENPVMIPFKNEFTFPKRAREEFLQQQYMERSSYGDNRPHKYQVGRSGAEMRPSFSEDEESAETNSSVD